MVAFEKTHDLRRLGEMCVRQDPAFAPHRDAVEPLTAYAVRFRYPGPADPTVQEVRAALTVVDLLRMFIVTRLPSDVRS